MGLPKYTGKLGVYHDRLLDRMGPVPSSERGVGDLLFLARRDLAYNRYFYNDQEKWREISLEEYRELLYAFMKTWRESPWFGKLNKANLRSLRNEILASITNGTISIMQKKAGKEQIKKAKKYWFLRCPSCKKRLPDYCFKKYGKSYGTCNWCRGVKREVYKSRSTSKRINVYRKTNVHKIM